MAVTSNSLITTQTPRAVTQTFAQGTDPALTFKTLFTGGSNGSKVVACVAATTDTTLSHLFRLAYTPSGGNPRYLAAITIPAGAGHDGADASVDLLSASSIPGLPIDNDGQKYIFLGANDTLQGHYDTNLTSAKQIDIVTIGADF